MRDSVVLGRYALASFALWFTHLMLFGFAVAVGEDYLSGIEWPDPPVVAPGETDASAPSDAVVLFDGKDLSAWNHAESWTVDNGIAIVGNKSIESKEKFGDCQVHLEWAMPADFADSRGQSRGNSGLYFMPHRNHRTNSFGKYEIQILDSYESKTYPDGQAGAIYRQMPPMVNAMRAPGRWNTFDVIFVGPKFGDDGSLLAPAYATIFHNGVLIHHHYPLLGPTAYNKPPTYSKHDAELPIGIQSHGNRVQFRNIWVRKIQPIVGEQVRPPYYQNRETGETRPARLDD